MVKRWDNLVESEQALLGTTEIEYLLPLVSRGELRGVLALGKRQTDLTLSKEDIDILMLLAAQAAVAAENVGLVQALQTRLAEMERIRNDLTEAQRRLAENQEVSRIRLAQELHDGAVQQLLGISYQLVRSNGSTETIRNLTYNQARDLSMVPGAEVQPPLPREGSEFARAEAANTASRYEVTYRVPNSPASDDLAKQLIVLLGTLVTAVASFYFGANSVQSAANTVANVLRPGDGLISLTESGRAACCRDRRRSPSH